MKLTSVDEAVASYLDRLRSALGPVSAPRRDEILDGIAQHLSDARKQSPAATDAELYTLLERLGSPEEIASEALAHERGESVDSSVPRLSRRRRWGLAVLAIGTLAVGAALGLEVHQGAPGKPSDRTSLAPGGLVSPNVLGSTQAVAMARLRQLHLEPRISYIRLSGGQVAGLVVSQSPPPGIQVQAGSMVRITISR